MMDLGRREALDKRWEGVREESDPVRAKPVGAWEVPRVWVLPEVGLGCCCKRSNRRVWRAACSETVGGSG